MLGELILECSEITSRVKFACLFRFWHFNIVSMSRLSWDVTAKYMKKFMEKVNINACRVEGVSRVCQCLCGRPGDKELPGIVGIGDPHHTRFNMKVTFGGLKTILTDTKNSLGVGKGWLPSWGGKFAAITALFRCSWWSLIWYGVV